MPDLHPDLDRGRICAAFGERLLLLRRRRKLTQEELARRAGLHRTVVGGIERGEENPSLVTLVRLARALEVDAGELLDSSLAAVVP